MTVTADHAGILTDWAWSERAKGQTAESLFGAFTAALSAIRARLSQTATDQIERSAPRPVTPESQFAAHIDLTLTTRESYRHALGIAPGRLLTVAAFDWHLPAPAGSAAPNLLTHRYTSIPFDAFPGPAFAVAYAPHPHLPADGDQGFVATVVPLLRNGLLMLDATAPAHHLIAAAHLVIGDGGPHTAYAAALGLPVLCVGHLNPDADWLTELTVQGQTLALAEDANAAALLASLAGSQKQRRTAGIGESVGQGRDGALLAMLVEAARAVLTNRPPAASHGAVTGRGRRRRATTHRRARPATTIRS